jgi:xanthine dehydrogenase YagS FAD-binding subunit
LDGDKIADCRIVLGSVAPIPWRAKGAEEMAVGMKNEPEAWAAIAKRALEGAEPLSENAYKVPLTEGLIEKAFRHLSMEDA